MTRRYSYETLEDLTKQVLDDDGETIGGVLATKGFSYAGRMSQCLLHLGGSILETKKPTSFLSY